MQIKKISTLLALSILTAPIVPCAANPKNISTEASSSSFRAANRRMKHQLAAAPLLEESFDMIHPPSANHIDAPMPCKTSDEVVGIYGNILYPEDQERIQLKKLMDWIAAYSKNPNASFPLCSEELNDLSLYRLDSLPLKAIRHFFAQKVQESLIEGQSLEAALEGAKQKTLEEAAFYRKMAENVPPWKGRCEILIAKLLECADQMDQIIAKDQEAIQKNPEKSLKRILKSADICLIEPPFTWDVRRSVLKQMIDRVTAVSPNSPYFLALQEVTPQALSDLKKTLADRDLQWISFSHFSGKETLPPHEEEVLGEATGFTSTFALSRDLEVLKVELGDLPTESGSIRKILGVKVRNLHTDETFHLFTTHTDHVIQNDLYSRTAAKIHEFATRFFEGDPGHFVMGGDLNAFEQSGGDQYIQKLRELFLNSQDFRETDYYAPSPIAWTTFIGRNTDSSSTENEKGRALEPNALDHILVGKEIELCSAAKEAGVYNDEGTLLNYYENREEYLKQLEKKITFSDHLFNIVRFKLK